MYDLEKLLEELPTHPIQLWIKSEHEKKAKAYWEQMNRYQQEPPKETETFITIVQAMTIFRVSDETIRRWVRSGLIGTKKEKGRRLVNLHDIHLYHERFVSHRAEKRKAG